MLDRIPTYPGRVRLAPVPGQTDTYDMVRADEPTQAGDALNKANLLPDAVATALGLTGNPQVKDALLLIDTVRMLADSKAKIATGSYLGTDTYGESNPNSLTFDREVVALQIWYALTTTLNANPKTTAGFVGSGSTAVAILMLSEIPNDNTYYTVSIPSATSENNRSLKVKKSVDGKTVSWYSSVKSEEQCNGIQNIANKYYKYYYTATLR